MKLGVQMEAENASSSSWWNAETNWSICSGSIVNSVTLESSAISLNIEEPAVLSPLVLHPPSSGSAPCEIKISLVQKYELRQVYVRSSARVYEIYYAPNSRSENDYLCTVRCSVSDTAAADEQLPVSEQTDVERTGEDDWLEVKAANSPEGAIQKGNLYEATAEISDSEPCVSVTLRLLSLEDKGCVFVDEVYIFADPVDSSDPESQFGGGENASGNSFMAMLSPVLLQLSKAGVNQKQDSYSVEVQRENNSLDIASSQMDKVSTVNGNWSDVCATDPHELKVLEKNVAASEPVRLCTSTGVSDAGSKPNNVAKEFDTERVLSQLVDRVGNLESLLLRFEEKMLKPISSIDTRLQRVEEQLEDISKNSQYASFPACTRFSAPVFSCDESCVNSFRQDESDNLNPDSRITVGLEKMDEHSDSLADEGTHAKDTQLVQGLVVTAPEFTNCDEEDLNVGDSPRDTTVKPPNMSIDEALASALAGFLSSSHSNTLTQTLSMKVHEFSHDEDGDRHVTDSPTTQDEAISSPFIINEKPDGTECSQGSVSTSSFSSESRINMLGYLMDDFYGQDERKSDGQIDEGCIESAECDVGRTDISPVTEDVTVEEDILLKQVPSREEIDNLKSVESRTMDRVDITNEATDVTKASVEDVLNFSRAPWEVNFDMPILDVLFVSQGTSNPSTKSAIEALLCDVKSDTEASNFEKTDLMPVSQEDSTSSIKSFPIEALLCDASNIGDCTVEKTNLMFAPEEASITTNAFLNSPENSSSKLSHTEACLCVAAESNYGPSTVEEDICSQEASIKSSSELEALP